MNEEPPESKEVSHFHFNQLRTLRIAKGNERVPQECINVIAPASKFGLLFIGVSNGFKSLKLENILDLDEDKENKNIEENYYSQVVGCEPPILMALSADQKTLAVCIKRNANVFADMYDIAAFADPDEKPEAFSNVLLSSNGSQLKDFLWNPVIDTMYVFCMSDGSLGVHELTGMKLTITAALPNANATAACWSPKGKQIVVGKKDGSLSQYKPTLQEAKSIPAPNDEKYSVANICWVSTAQFIVLYVPEGQNVSPSLFVVSTPKNAPVVYMNFGDLCLGNANSDDQRYFLHHESAWGIMICASTDSIEVAVLGDSPSWVQWEIRDDCRALLPSKHGAQKAVSMGVMYSSQRNIVISETEVYPPMPIIFYLTDNGLLVSYHLVNTAPGCANLVRPSTPIGRENERKQIGNKKPSAPAPLVTSPFPPQPPLTMTPTIGGLPAFQSPQLQQQPAPPTVLSGTPPSFGLGQKSSFLRNDTPPIGAVPFQTPTQKTNPAPLGLFQTPPNPVSPVESERFHKASKGQPLVTPTTPVSKDLSGIRQVAVAQRMIPGAKPENEKDVHCATADTSSKQIQPQNLSGAGDSTPKLKEDSTQMAYLSAIFEEVQTFEKELIELRNLRDHVTDIGIDEERENLISSSIKFQEFQREMSDTMSSLNQDVHNLKNILLESFCIVEEANSRDRRKNDHVYISMLKDRALDPISAKRMDSIKQSSMYLSTQLQEVQNKLDLDWFEYLERNKKKQRATHHLQSTDAIYKTVAKNRQTIHFLEKNVEYLSKKADEKKRENIYKRNMYRNKSPFKRADNEDLSKLADAFLQTKIGNYEEEKPQPQKKMSSGAQDFLKKYLSSSTIKSVRPTIINSPSQSRLLSKCLSYSESPSEKTAIQSTHDGNSSISMKKPGITTQHKSTNNKTPIQLEVDRSPNTFPSSMMKPSMKMQPPILTNENKSPINKPIVTSATEFEKLRLQNRLPVSNDNILSDQYKSSVDKGASMFSQSSLSFAPLKHKQPVPPEIESPIYEDITPPDSPDLSKYSQGVPETKTLQVSFKQGVPEVQQGTSSPFGIKGITSEKSAPVQDTKQSSLLFTPPSNTSVTNLKSFSTSSSNLTNKLSFIPPSADVASKSSPSLTPKDKPEENTTNFGAKPASEKPASSTFSFIPSSSNVSFPNFTGGSSFLSKKEDSFFKPSPLASEPASSPKDSSQGGENSSAPTPSIFSVPDLESDPAKSSIVLPQKPLGSDSKFESFKFTPTATTAVTSGSEATSLFGKGSSATKGMSFFTSPFSTSTSTLSTFSFTSPTAKEMTPPSTEAKSTPTAEPPQRTPEKVVKDSPDSPTVSPVNLSQKNAAEASTTTANPDSFINSPPSQEVTPSTNTLVEGVSKPLTFSIPQVSTPTTVGTLVPSVSQPSAPTSTASVLSQPVSSQPPSTTVVTSSSFFGGGIVTTTAPDTTPAKPVSQAPASLFSSPDSSAAPTGSVLGQSTTSSFFNQPGSTSFFTKPADAPAFGLTSSIFGATTAAVTTTTTSTTASSFFSQTTSAGQTPVFGGTTATTTSSVFGGTPANPTGTSVFGGTPSTTTGSSVFGGTPSTTAGTSVFGGTPTTTGTSVFGSTTSTTAGTSVFGGTPTTTGTSVFGAPATGSTVFGGAPSGNTGSSVFGGGTANTSGNPVFGQTTPIKSPFGQNQGSFGLAKSVFGQQNSNTAAPVFGQPASPAANTTPFGQTSTNTGFGQGGFFSGLGSKPSAENASKNVFSVGNLSAQPSEGNVFGATTFGAAKPGGAFSGGSFSSGGQSVAQSGFGAFQTTPQKTGGFGAAPAFGGAPAFGSPPAFGNAPTFGGSSLGAVFGTSQGTQNANFSNFAAASSPTFGSLASQSPGGFGSVANQPTFGQTTPFGGTPAFGGAPSFGGQPNSGFGAPSSTPGASAFTQWRN